MLSHGFLLHFVILILPICGVKRDSHFEKLEINYLSHEYVVAKFSFKTTTSANSQQGSNGGHHYNLFPKLIGELTDKYSINELHLSLTQGFWRNWLWGDPLGVSKPIGAQISAWFLPGTNNVDETWKYLIHALSGLFCASFSQIDPKFTVIPENDNGPMGAIQKTAEKSLNKTLSRCGVLPSENVCTENLTPWKKLLPCKSARGISQLLNPLKIFNSAFSSITLDIRRVCFDENCHNVELELVQTIAVVFRSRSLAKGFSLTRLFQGHIDGDCSLAEDSRIIVTAPGDVSTINFNPPPVYNLNITTSTVSASYPIKDLLKNQSSVEIELELKSSNKKNGLKNPIPKRDHFIAVHTFFSGSGQVEGKLISLLENRMKNSTKILYSQVIPWYIRVYFYTLEFNCNGVTLKPDSIFYRPAKDRHRPHYIELTLSLPIGSQCKLSIGYEKTLLRWTEYPPDAHRGFYVPAPSITYRDETKNIRKIFGEVLLVTLPTPDFSMPYNVICLVCTVIALAFGPIHNLTTRRLILMSKNEIERKSLKFKLKNASKIVKLKILARPVLFVIILLLFVIFVCFLPFAFCSIACNIYCKHFNVEFLCLT